MDTSFLAGMRYMPQINDPFIGENLGFKHQSKISDFSAKSRIIAGKGVKVTETPQGIIIEACNISKTITYTGASKLADAVVGTIKSIENDGSYRVSINGEDGSPIIDYSFEVNSAVETVDQYNEGDKIMCFPILMPEAPVGEL